MAIKFKDFMKGNTSRKVASEKAGNYKGLAVRQITLENGKVGLIGEDNYEEFTSKNYSEDKDGDIVLSADCRLTNKGFWTDRAKSEDNEGFQPA